MDSTADIFLPPEWERESQRECLLAARVFPPPSRLENQSKLLRFLWQTCLLFCHFLLRIIFSISKTAVSLFRSRSCCFDVSFKWILSWFSNWHRKLEGISLLFDAHLHRASSLSRLFIFIPLPHYSGRLRQSSCVRFEPGSSATLLIYYCRRLIVRA